MYSSVAISIAEKNEYDIVGEVPTNKLAIWARASKIPNITLAKRLILWLAKNDTNIIPIDISINTEAPNKKPCVKFIPPALPLKTSFK